MRKHYHFSDEYILKKSNDWLDRAFKDIVRKDAYEQLWDIEMVSISRQPGSESDADKLTDHMHDLTTQILRRLAYADGKPIESVEDPNDGRMRIVD